MEGMEPVPPPSMNLPEAFLRKPPERLRQELAGMPGEVLEAALRLQVNGRFSELEALLPGFITYHLPPKTAPPPDPLPRDFRLREDIGLDSLALSEMAFKLDEVFGVPIETTEVAHVMTVEDLCAFLTTKLAAPPEAASSPPTGDTAPT